MRGFFLPYYLSVLQWIKIYGFVFEGQYLLLNLNHWRVQALQSKQYDEETIYISVAPHTTLYFCGN